MREAISTWMKQNRNSSDIGEAGNVHRMNKEYVELATELKKLDPRSGIWVVGTHKCYSAVMPVLCIEFPSCGLRIYARCNFMTWAMSVQAESPIEGMSNDGMSFNGLSACYFEGFAPANAPVYEEGYPANKARFSFFASGHSSTLRLMVMRVYNALRKTT